MGGLVRLNGGYNGPADWLDGEKAVYGSISRLWMANDELPEFYRRLARTAEPLGVMEISLPAPTSVRGNRVTELTVMLNYSLNNRWEMDNTNHVDPVVVVLVKQPDGQFEPVESHAKLTAS